MPRVRTPILRYARYGHAEEPEFVSVDGVTPGFAISIYLKLPKSVMSIGVIEVPRQHFAVILYSQRVEFSSELSRKLCHACSSYFKRLGGFCNDCRDA